MGTPSCDLRVLFCPQLILCFKKAINIYAPKKNLKRSILLRTTTILTTMRMATATTTATTTTMTAASPTKEVSSGRSHNPQGGIRHLNTNGENKASSEKKKNYTQVKFFGWVLRREYSYDDGQHFFWTQISNSRTSFLKRRSLCHKQTWIRI